MHARYVNGEFDLEALVRKTLMRIDALNPDVGAFITVHRERALKRARAIEEKRARKEKLGKLAGVIIGIKDNIHIEGEITTCASKFLANYRAPFSATVVQRLEAEDAILIGKTNLDEFAMGSSNETSSYGLCRNPWDLTRVPGGSSGGSAAATAARFCPISLGTDTGGSIRQPAALCGVVGFKPTYGKVSRYGAVAFASTLDQIGPFATSVADIALTMDVMGGACENDPTSIKEQAENYRRRLGESIKGKVIGLPRSFLSEGLPEETLRNFETAITELQELGATVVDVDLKVLEHSLAVYYIIGTAEAATNLARFDGIRYGQRSERAQTLSDVYNFSKGEGFGFQVRNRIMLGTYVLSAGYKDAHYKKAQVARDLIIQKYNEAFAKCDVIAMPVSPTPAFKLGQIGRQDPVQMYLQDIYTISANLAGLPAISVPSGFSSENLPFGLQLTAPKGKDGDLIAFASAYEKAQPYGAQIPKEFDCEVEV